MNKTDVLTGRIIQRVIDARNNKIMMPSVHTKVSITHGVDNTHDITRLVENLFKNFPDSVITLKKLKFGYALNIEVDLL